MTETSFGTATTKSTAVAVTYGGASSSRSLRVTRGNCLPSVTSPSGDQSGDVSVSYFLEDDRAGTASIVPEYSTDEGSTWSTATKGTGGDATDNLTTSATSPGQSHTFVWDTVTNLGIGFFGDALFRIRAYDQASLLGSYEASTEVQVRVDNVPAAMTLVSPADGYFDKDETPVFVGTIPNPVAGNSRLHFKLEVDTDSDFGSPTVFESRLSQTGWEYDSDGAGAWTVVPATGVPIPTDPTLIGNQVRYTIQTTDKLDRDTYNWRMTAGDTGLTS